MKANQQKRFLPKLKIQKGDTVKIIAGKNKGKTGVVLQVFSADNRALVEGVNIVKRHTKPTAQESEGGIIEKEAPIHISNIMLLHNGATTRVGRKVIDGKIVRVAKKSQEVIK
jgi:large subunit ribosomal protein L24